VPSLKLNANLMKLAHFNDLGPAKNDPSAFKLITTDLALADERISSKVIDIDGYGVDVDGSGSVSVSGSDELNYRGLAEITTKESFFTNTIARLSGVTLKDGKLQFPFRIGGEGRWESLAPCRLLDKPFLELGTTGKPTGLASTGYLYNDLISVTFPQQRGRNPLLTAAEPTLSCLHPRHREVS